MKQSTIPEAQEAYALMTGIGSCEDDILQSGMARLACAEKNMPESVRPVASPAFKQRADARAVMEEELREASGTAYQSGTLRTGIGR